MKIEQQNLFCSFTKMETSDTVSLEDYDTENLSEICHSLQKSSVKFAEEFETTYQQFKLFRKKVKAESSTLDAVPLKPRAHTRKWLEANGLSQEISFGDFFDFLLSQLAARKRLDLTSRSLLPTKDVANLYRIPVEKPISIFDLLERTPTLFH
jgi:hypothetical protein